MNDLLSSLPFAFPHGSLFGMPTRFFFSPPPSSFLPRSVGARVCARTCLYSAPVSASAPAALWEYLHIKSESVIILTCEMRRTQKSPGADIIAN